LVWFRGRRQDSSDRGFNDGQWKGGGWDVLKGNMASRISSKDLFDERVLGGRRKEVFLLVFAIGKFVGGDVGEDIKTVDGSGRDGGTSNNISGAIGDVKEGVVLWVVKGRPGELRGWETWDKRSRCWGSVSVKIRTWEIPSIVVRLEDLKDSGGGVGDILLIYVIKGRPGSNGDVGEGGGDDSGGLRGSECRGRSPRHHAFKESQAQVLPKPPLS